MTDKPMTLVQALEAMNTIGCNPEMIKHNAIAFVRAFADRLEGEEMKKGFEKWCPQTYKIKDEISGDEATYVYAPASIDLAKQAWQAALAVVREAIG